MSKRKKGKIKHLKNYELRFIYKNINLLIIYRDDIT